MLLRVPRPALRPFVKVLWASDETLAPELERAERELVLPTGTAHVAFRLSAHPLHVFDAPADRVGRELGHAVLGGPRAASYVRDVSRPARGVGAQLQPGALALLTGVDAAELAGRHTRLDDLFGQAAARVRERLLEAATPGGALDVLEDWLAERLPRVRGVHPAVAHALARFTTTDDVGHVVGECGYSHRRFIELFRQAVGLGPKQYCRVARLQRAVELTAADPELGLAELAAASGFGDQPHLCRDFRQLAGLSPAQYRRARPKHANHVPLR
jgi:AraC-like DNA-binding protein